MQLELNLEGGKYPIKVKINIDSESGLPTFSSELVGANISTFPHHQNFSGKTLEESITKLSQQLIKSLKELMDD